MSPRNGLFQKKDFRDSAAVFGATAKNQNFAKQVIPEKNSEIQAGIEKFNKTQLSVEAKQFDLGKRGGQKSNSPSRYSKGSPKQGSPAPP